MSDTHTTTGSDVVSLNGTVGINDGDESNIVGQDVDRVVGWNSDGDLELSRKVGRTIEWLKVLDGITSDLLFVEPDLVVGSSAGEKVLG